MPEPTRKVSLISLRISPWTERAKWALDHHQVAYEVVEHAPVLGEARLRKIVGPGKARATVPVLVAEGLVLTESWDIALYADRVGRGAKLVPPENHKAIEIWTARADEAMSAGRALVMAAMLASPRALDENSPPFVPRALRPLLRPVARRVTRAFMRKYDLRLEHREEQTRIVRAALERLRDGLGASPSFLLGSFSYADIAMATLLQGIAPVDSRFIRLGQATREAWTRPDLASEYADLVAWRDRLYATLRQPAGASPLA